METKETVELFDKVLDLVGVEGKGWWESCIEVGVHPDEVGRFLEGMKVWVNYKGGK